MAQLAFTHPRRPDEHMYRTPAKQRSEAVDAPFDYAARIEADQQRVVFNSFRIMLAVLTVVGLLPFMTWFGVMGIPIAIASAAFIAVPLAIRARRSSAMEEMDRYEESLLRKASRRNRM